MQATVSLLDAALYYANKLGWAVFPLSPGSKVPRAGSNGMKDATKDEKQIKEWWNEDPSYNIGIATGEISGIVAMDIDPRNGGTETLFKKSVEHGKIPPTITFKTGGGGVHYIFKHPGWKVSSKGIFDGMDSKGDGGYIIAPPSLHASGNRYEVQTMNVLADMPDWWATHVRGKEPVKGVRKIINKKIPRDKYINGEIIPEGGRDNTLHKIASSMRTFGLEQDEIYTLLSEVNEKRCSPPMHDKDIVRISKSAAQYEAGVVVEVDFGKEKVTFSVDNLETPPHYQIEWEGIYHTSYRKDIPSTKKIFPLPVEITRRLQNVDTGAEKIEISFYRDGKWIPIIVPRSIAFNTSKIIDLSDRGLPVSSANAKDLVRYLTDFEAANLDMQPDLSVGRMGWVGTDRFFPGLDEGIKLDASDSFTKGYICSGSVAKWAHHVAPILEFPIARFILSSSFASPLLKILNVRSFVIYVYGPSGGGKSTAIKVGLSVWGNPTDTLVTFGDTVVSIERRAAFLCNVPLGLDERQSASDQAKVEQLIYMLANGKSKGKGTRDGIGIQDQMTWDLVTMATGEDSLTSDNSKGGVVTRTIEVFAKPIPDELLASSLHETLDEAYGVAGPEFIHHILNEREYIKNLFTEVKEDLRLLYSGNIGTHLSSVSSVVVADYYMNKLFFNKDDITDSLHLASNILQQLITRDDMDDAKRAYDALMSWFAVNQNSFTDFSKEEFGWINKTPPDYIYIYPTIFKRTMKELGFNEKRIKQEWAQRGWIKTEEKSPGKITFSIKSQHKEKGRQRVIAVKGGQISP